MTAIFSIWRFPTPVFHWTHWHTRRACQCIRFKIKGRADPVLAPLGPAPAWLDADQKKVWELFGTEFPWLAASDRALVELASRLRCRMLYEKDPPLGCLALLRRCISGLGGSPADRSRIAAPAGVEDDRSRHFVE
jgi:hypothetical protein